MTPVVRKRRIPIEISREDAANILNLSPQTVSDLAEAGYLQTLGAEGSQQLDLVSVHTFRVLAQWGTSNE